MLKKTILLVDNNPDFLETRGEFLTQHGYRVCLASCPAEALALFQREVVDLGVFDLRLQNDNDPKDYSGVCLARKVAPYIPVIILTEHPNVPAVRLALGLNHEGMAVAVDFVAKMEGLDALLQAVEEAPRWGTSEL